MPDQSSAAEEHALLAEITAPLSSLPEDAVAIAADVDFPVVLRGYDRVAVEAYVKRTSQLVAELQAARSPEAAVRRALERVGEEISGILKRAHETSAQITTQSRREAEDRLEVARSEAEQTIGAAQRRVTELDAETDRIWSERQRIVEDARQLAQELLALADAAARRFPAAPEDEASGPDEDGAGPEERDTGGGFGGEGEQPPRGLGTDGPPLPAGSTLAGEPAPEGDPPATGEPESTRGTGSARGAGSVPREDPAVGSDADEPPGLFPGSDRTPRRDSPAPPTEETDATVPLRTPPVRDPGQRPKRRLSRPDGLL